MPDAGRSYRFFGNFSRRRQDMINFSMIFTIYFPRDFKFAACHLFILRTILIGSIIHYFSGHIRGVPQYFVSADIRICRHSIDANYGQ